MDVIVHAKCLGNSLHPFVILTRLETGDLSMFNICSERFSGPLGGQFCRQSPWKERFSCQYDTRGFTEELNRKVG